MHCNGFGTNLELHLKGYKKIGLLGTKFTMEMDFYKNKLSSFGLEVLIPEKQETREYIQFTLREELGIGFINPETKEKYKEIIMELVERGAECIVLGCTEIPMLVSQEDFEIPVFDTTKIHSSAIVNFMLSQAVRKTTNRKQGFCKIGALVLG